MFSRVADLTWKHPKLVLAAVAAERDEPDEAARFLGHAEQLRDESGVAAPAFSLT